MRERELDVVMRELAERQHGLLTRKQARSLGCGDDAYRRRLASPDWEAESGRVLRLVGSPRTYRQRCMAATLDAGGVLSHESAAALWRLPGWPSVPPIVSCDQNGGQIRSQLTAVTRTRALPYHHVTELFGIPVTTVARLAFDMAGRVHPKRVERLVDNTIARRLTTPAAIRRVMNDLAARGRRGGSVMQQIMSTRPDDYVPPDSGLEARFFDILKAAGLPLPVRQRNLGADEWAGRVDYVLMSYKLVFEIDSWLHHWSKLDKKADEARDERLRAAGLEVEHISEDLVWYAPRRVVAVVENAIAKATRRMAA